MTFDPTSVEVTCVTRLYPRIIVSKSHENTWKYVDTVTFFAKKLEPKVIDPRWPLTPHLLRSHVWLYPRIIVSKSHENTSKYVDTVNLFVKTWTKGHWPLDDLWPNICWGHMGDSSQGSLCPSSMGIHQCMWIQWSILQKLPHTYIHILHTHTTYRISDHIVSFWTTFRRDNKNKNILHHFHRTVYFWQTSWFCFNAGNIIQGFNLFIYLFIYLFIVKVQMVNIFMVHSDLWVKFRAQKTCLLIKKHFVYKGEILNCWVT